jgi:hypothetical protein
LLVAFISDQERLGLLALLVLFLIRLPQVILPAEISHTYITGVNGDRFHLRLQLFELFSDDISLCLLVVVELIKSTDVVVGDIYKVPSGDAEV